jgi:hypothetical protein
MTTRDDITNVAGAPVPLESLSDSERRALDALSGAGLIAPLPPARDRAGAAIAA